MQFIIWCFWCSNCWWNYQCCSESLSWNWVLFAWHFLSFLVQVKPQCVVNEDCPNPDICQLGNCLDACRATTCGTNAVCTSSNHRADCKCLQGFRGEPFTACSKCKILSSIYHCAYSYLVFIKIACWHVLCFSTTTNWAKSGCGLLN